MVDIDKKPKSIEIMVALPTISAVKEFVNITNNCPCEALLISDRYVVDAKSIMGIFSLDLSKPVKFKTETNFGSKQELDAFMSAINDFVVLA